MRIYYLTADLGPSGPAALLARLAPALRRGGSAVAVGVVCPPTGPAIDALRAEGVEPAPLPIRNSLDLNGYLAVRSAVDRFVPDVVHALGPLAARVGALLRAPRVGVGRPLRLVVTAADRAAGGVLGWLTGRAVRRADVVTAMTRAEAERYRNLGVPPERVAVIPPGVCPSPPPPDPAGFRRSLGIPDTARLVFAAGRFDTVDGLKSAVWAFDVVKYAAPDLYLVLVGDGPERGRLERFGRALGFDDYRVRFAGRRADLPGLFGLAEVVWVTHDRGGVTVALEAMAAGKPVVAARTPDLAEVVEDGVTGRLVLPGDRVQLAAVTNELLERPDRAGALGAAGRDRAAGSFSAAAMVERFARAYDGLVSGGARTA